MKCPNPWNKELAACTFYSEKFVSSLSWVILNLLKSYQKPGTQLIGLKKKFAGEQFSNVSNLFQFSQNDSKNDKQSQRAEEHSQQKSYGRETTDKKRTISADKLNNLGS